MPPFETEEVFPLGFLPPAINVLFSVGSFPPCCYYLKELFAYSRLSDPPTIYMGYISTYMQLFVIPVHKPQRVEYLSVGKHLVAKRIFQNLVHFADTEMLLICTFIDQIEIAPDCEFDTKCLHARGVGLPAP